MKKVTLELNEEQAKLLSDACEFYARMRMGQFGEIIWCCAKGHYVDRPEEAQQLWLQLRKIVMPDLTMHPGHSLGVGHIKEADLVFDIHQVLRSALGDKREPWSAYDLPTVKVEEVADGPG